MATEADQIELSLSLPLDADASAPVECLGLTFANDAERRAYFLDKLREQLQDPEFRQIEGFPIGADEDILALSDPPYYTACPNPFLADFIRCYGKPYDPETDDYHREPFAADVSEGKSDPIYTAHSYHTKVPHKAIMRYILHYTEPGDVVFDGFCGTGMTGVAAQMCGDRTTVESLGYRVKPDGTILDEDKKPFSKLGARRTILNDLSPAATFIAYNYNTPVDIAVFEREAKRILAEVEKECGWMYTTLHQPTDEQIESALDLLQTGQKPVYLETHLRDANISYGRTNYTVWSDVFLCECAGEVVFWNEAVDKVAGKILDKFHCPHCDAELTKKCIERSLDSPKYDSAIQQTVHQAKQAPALINYTFAGKPYKKTPNAFDVELIEKIEQLEIPYWFPIDRMIDGGETRRNDPIGITHVHHFYTKRNLLTLSALHQRISATKLKALINLHDNMLTRCSRQSSLHISNFFHGGGGVCKGHLSGTLYIPSLSPEIPTLKVFADQLRTVSRGLSKISHQSQSIAISNQSASHIETSNASVDYIFLDPPFGSNLMYSELNFINEAWLKVFTNNKSEAIENKSQGKGLNEYRDLMTQCFRKAYRILKPGRWITIEFSNTQATVWNTIQTALQESGFVVANVSALDKKQGSFKAVTTTTAVKQDLVISAYKPSEELENSLAEETPESVWDFVRTHLGNLPIVKMKVGELEFITERDPRILYDRMISYFFRRGYSNSISLSSPEFQAGLKQRFLERDGMVFLREQAIAYDRTRGQNASAPQIELFVYDEKTSIDWLYHLLKKRPSTYQDIQPEYLKQVSASWRKHESRSELLDLLRSNFLRYEGDEEVPNQIHSYLSTNYKDLRNLAKEDPRLISKAKERWYVPNPEKASEREKIRASELLREFEIYRQSKQKKIKEFRIEAIRAGFKAAWRDREYQTIIDIAHKLPNDVVEEDEELSMYHDMSQTRLVKD
jgi:hypothetical protein